MPVVIIGNSAAALSALEAFRKIDRSTPVSVIFSEGKQAYSRVLLPYYLSKKTHFENLFMRQDEYFEAINARHVDAMVSRVEVSRQIVEMNDGAKLPFERLLIATGSSPNRPAIPGLEHPGVHHMWTLDDAAKIERLLKKGGRVLVIGAGFIALQAAWSAVQTGLQVTVSVRSHIMRRDLDDRGRDILRRRMEKAGVNLLEGTLPERIEKCSDGALAVHMAGAAAFQVDLVVVATGVRANTEFLEGSGIGIDQGILVNARMQTDQPGIYAAGDVAQGPNAISGEREVHALWPTAIEQGKIAGANMAGRAIDYQGSLNMNVTELFGIVVASMGRFQETAGAETWIHKLETGDGYLKLVLNDGVPIGGVGLGDPEVARLLGMVRPLIRQKRPFNSSAANFVRDLEMIVHPRLRGPVRRTG